MHPDISEFSYGYALTEALIAASPRTLRAAPIFPSLIEEGSPGGGYDVQIPFAGFPLFLQFKLSHRMVRSSAAEVQKGVLAPPFYRMHLRPTKHSQQHPMLLSLEASGAVVYYAAPFFHTPAELNDAYTKRKVLQRSIFIKPSDIGSLPDDDNHHVAFKKGFNAYLCSDTPRLIRRKNENHDFIDELRSEYSSGEYLDSTEASAEAWALRLEKIVRAHSADIKWVTDEKLDALRDRRPLTRFAYLARTFFGCDVVVISPDEAG
jgi:hypothetical protein